MFLQHHWVVLVHLFVEIVGSLESDGTLKKSNFGWKFEIELPKCIFNNYFDKNSPQKYFAIKLHKKLVHPRLHQTKTKIQLKTIIFTRKKKCSAFIEFFAALQSVKWSQFYITRGCRWWYQRNVICKQIFVQHSGCNWFLSLSV